MRLWQSKHCIVTRGAAADTLLGSYNDLDSVRRLFEENRDQIAAVVVEPIAGNMGVVPPGEGFLRGLRRTCDAEGALLVFDEVISGFRVGPGGAQALFGIRPDLTCLGKIIGENERESLRAAFSATADADFEVGGERSDFLAGIDLGEDVTALEGKTGDHESTGFVNGVGEVNQLEHPFIDSLRVLPV